MIRLIIDLYNSISSFNINIDQNSLFPRIFPFDNFDFVSRFWYNCLQIILINVEISIPQFNLSNIWLNNSNYICFFIMEYLRDLMWLYFYYYSWTNPRNLVLLVHVFILYFDIIFGSQSRKQFIDVLFWLLFFLLNSLILIILVFIISDGKQFIRFDNHLLKINPKLPIPKINFLLILNLFIM